VSTRRRVPEAAALLLAACARAPECLAPRSTPASASALPAGSGAASPSASPPALPPGPPTTPPTVAGARIGFSREGAVGAWLVAGPLDAAVPENVTFQPRLHAPAGLSGDAARWRLASTARGPLDLGPLFDDTHGPRGTAYAGGVLHLETPRRVLLLLGTDGDAAVWVDGRCLLAREQVPARLVDDVVVPADLGSGDHDVVLVLHRRAGAWGLRVRLLDSDLRPLTGAWWVLPSTGPEDAEGLARRMLTVRLDRGVEANSYRPTIAVSFHEGAPMGVDLPIRAEVVRVVPGSRDETPSTAESRGTLAAGEDHRVVLQELGADSVEESDFSVHVDVAGTVTDLPFRPRRLVREAIARADRALGSVEGATGLAPASLETVQYLRDRLAGFVSRGDLDFEAQRDDALALDDLSAALERGFDPYTGQKLTPSAATDGSPDGREPWRTGPMRRAYRSPVDGHLSEFAVYVPPDFDERRTYPLIVALHGMNGRPMAMIMWLFGHDDPARDGFWEDRHPRKDLARLEAIVVAPDGHSNSMYRDLGEDDVMRVVDWAIATYPIDEARVTVTGPSMGGIGAAACALHRPDRFAAAEPLCGYQSYFVRTDIAGRPLRSWERFIAEQRSNVFWAENGLHLPLYIVHGTRDLPEENSGVLIDRYKELHYLVDQEHPDLGHNVWQTTYEDLKGARWLLAHRRPLHPRAVRFKTPGTRWADDAWVHVRELASSGAWGQTFARIDDHNELYVTTRGVSGLGLDRDVAWVDDTLPVFVHVDGSTLAFAAGEPIEIHRAAGDSSPWQAGPATHPGPFKHGTVTGPIRDVFHEPITFVWGAADPAQSKANEWVAREWARVQPGVRVDYPVMSDTEFLGAGEPIANDRALFLVGNSKSNAVLREIEPEMPIRIENGAVVLGEARVTPKVGDLPQLGVAFIRPNPRRPDRYVVVVEGVGSLGTWRSLSLPDMLPDYVVFDEDVAPARGRLTLGPATVRRAGFFDTSWALPAREPD
jgi:poly(3-hydroxybutyrate) depolymerase